MKYLYDLLAKLIKKKRTAKLVYKLVSLLIYLILIAVVTILLVIRIKRVGFDISGSVFVVCILYLLFCLFDELFFKVRYLHVSHNKDIRSVLHGMNVKTVMRNPHGKDVFSCTFENDAYIDCTYDRNKYKFTVKNDEWDEVESFTCGEADFEKTFKAAAEFACSLEKKPDGEYDESLMPEEDYEDEEFEEDEDADAGDEYYGDGEEYDEENKEE